MWLDGGAFWIIIKDTFLIEKIKQLIILLCKIFKFISFISIMSDWKFITNKERILNETIENILPTTEKIDLLVGFFFFSGFKWLAENLKDKKIRVLIWMEVELSIKNTLKEYYNTPQEQQNYSNSKQNFLTQLKEAFNKTDIFDNEDTKKSVEIFIEKIQNWTLEIRKTREPNHSKLYLFHEKEETNHGGDRPGTLITWSSNFSYSGFCGRYELNARFDDKQSFNDWEAVFEDLWDDSIEITQGWENDDVVHTLKKETWLNIPYPYYCYVRLLKEYFNTKDYKNIETPETLTKWDFKDLKYQVDAIEKWLKIINEHNWVIVADVVWLGKSIIWATLIANLWKRAIVIAPPHLKPQWEEYSENFWLNLSVYSSWKIEEALERDKKATHEIPVLLVDEAHRYRNSETIDYGYLHQIAQGKKVILLSATPFNNQPEDIFNLISLFQIPKKSTLQTSKLLMYEFSELQNKYEKTKRDERNEDISSEEAQKKFDEVSSKMKELIQPLLLRRSRIDLEETPEYQEDLKKQNYNYSTVEDPKTLEYDLGDIKDLYIDTIDNFLDPSNKKVKNKKFKCARYTPLLYLKKESEKKYEEKFDKLYWYSIGLIKWRQENMPLFITRQIVGRFESSLWSFKNTLSKIISSYEVLEKWINKYWKIPIIRKWTLPTTEETNIENLDIPDEEFKNNDLEEILEKWNWFALDKDDLEDDFFENLEKDKKVLEDLKEQWWKVQKDPKLESFTKEIKNRIDNEPQRKIVIFSQYSDTVDEICSRFEREWLRVLKVTGNIKNKKIKNSVIKNFDAWLSQEEQENNYDILVATDSISEGYNLHRAGVIFNYDIPFNPTVVMQRIWRINRINKKVFDKIYIYNYFPSLEGEELIRKEKVSKLKVNMINSILWSDTKILDENETLDSFYSNMISNEESFREEKSWDTEYLKFLQQLEKENPEILKKSEQLPHRSRVKRESNDYKNCIIVFAKKWSNFVFKKIDKETGEVEIVPIEEAFKMFEADYNEQWYEPSRNFYKYYNMLKEKIFEISKDNESNNQTRKALNNIKWYQKEFWTEYSKLLITVISKLWDLPDVYMKILRDIKKENYKEKIAEFKQVVSEDYLQSIIKKSQDFDEKEEELIISEEF